MVIVAMNRRLSKSPLNEKLGKLDRTACERRDFTPPIAQQKSGGAKLSLRGHATVPLQMPHAKAMQLKTANPIGAKHRPVAPPVYRPQPLPIVVQPKQARRLPEPFVLERKTPVAPPVFTAKAVPRVPQRREPVTLQLSKRGKKMTLGGFFAEVAAPPPVNKWAGGAPVIGAGAAAAAAAAPAAPRGRPALAVTSQSQAWDNAEIGNLVGLGGRPANFWADNRQSDGTSADGNTTYWTFEATWVKSGSITGAGDGRLNNGTQIDGTLKLHFHPHAKETANYLHVKRTDGADAKAGQISKTHWLVGAIGLDAKTVTPDGTQ
jgi:hypothetical protein